MAKSSNRSSNGGSEKGNSKGSPSGNSKPTKDLTIVGIGASAGGLDALERVFSKLHALKHCAIIIVTHMKPDQKSMLREILSKRTENPVVEAENGQLIQPGHIYTIPPNNELTVESGQIKLAVPPKQSGVRLPIDIFLKSLASASGPSSICMILSGSGSDGALGVKAIKHHGGIAIAQDPASAKFDNMPKSAIETGEVDIVLAPEDIPQHLMRYVEHLSNPHKTSAADSLNSDNSEDLGKIIDLLRDKTLCDFSAYKDNTLLRRLEKRILINSCNDSNQYYEILKTNSEEVKTLFRDFLINVTSFFRDPDVYEHLSTEIIPKLFKDKKMGNSVRIWCAGCSTGEEAYSLAILTREYLKKSGKHHSVQIFATDINPSAIEKARNGIFSEGISKEIPPDLLQQYFHHQYGHYKIARKIRDMIVFAPHDLLSDPPFVNLDLITCRNLLIYFRQTIQDRVLPLFYNAIKQDGFLLLGTSESLGNSSGYFGAVSSTYKTFRRLSGNQVTKTRIPETWMIRKKEQFYDSPISENYFSRFLEDHLLKKQTPPAVLINNKLKILFFHGNTALFFTNPDGAPTINVIDRAVSPLKGPLRAAIFRAIKENKKVTVNVSDLSEKKFSVNVEPLNSGKGDESFLAISFIKKKKEDKDYSNRGVPSEGVDPAITQLQDQLKVLSDELETTLEEYHTTTEQLNSSNQELLSINEELQSSNEELETSKEELQALNEELTTVNSELNSKIQELHAANSDINNLLDCSNIPFVVLDFDLRIRHFTPNITQLFHIISSDKGRRIDHIASRILGVNIKKACQHVLESLDFREVEVKTDEDRTFIKRIYPYNNTAKKLDGLIITFSDVTEIKNTQEELQTHKNQLELLVEERTRDLQRSEELLKATGKMAKVGGWELNWRNKKVWWTDETYRIFDLDPTISPDLGKALDFYLPKYQAQISDAVERCQKDGTPFDLEAVVISSKGHEKWVRAMGELRTSSQGNLIGGTVMDISAAKQTEIHYNNLLKRLNEAQHIACLGDWEWDAVQDNASWSDELYRIMEFDPSLSPPNYEGNLALYHPKDAAKLDEAVKNALNNKVPFDMELSRTRTDGSTMYLKSIGRIKEDENGKVTHLYGTILDITEIKIAEFALEKAALEAESANRAKSEFLANMSHEIRTPLNGIQGNLQLLELTKLNDEQKDFLKNSINSSHSLLTLINDILDLSKIESGQLVFKKNPLRISSLFESLHSIFDKDIKDKALELSLSREQNVPACLEGDLSRLRQILVNLIGNSVKYTDQGKIAVNIKLLKKLPENRAKVRIEVSDTGIGIPEKLLPTIFDPFTQASTPGQKKSTGTGLGLSIVKRLVKLMEGELKLESEVNIGTTFLIDLNFKVLPDDASEEADKIDLNTQPDNLVKKKRLSIIIAEDDVNNCTVLKKMLSLFGHEFFVANDGEQALEILKKEDVDLILMDLQMPVMDGIEATRLIRNSSEFSEKSTIPIVALTAHAMDVHKEKALNAGMNEFLTKPIIMKSLKVLLDRFSVDS